MWHKGPQKLLDEAYEKMNGDVIALAKDYIKKREQREKTRNKRPKKNEKGNLKWSERRTRTG